MNIKQENLPFILTELTNYLKDEGGHSLRKIAEAISITPSYLYSLRSSNSNASDDSRFEYFLRICRYFDISVDIKDNKIKISEGFDKEKYSEQYVLVLWNKKKNEIRFLKLYCYTSVGFGSMDTEDLFTKQQFDFTYSYNKNGVIFNEEHKEYYRFESLNIPRLSIFDKRDKENNSDFFVGKEMSESYFGSLFLAFHIDFKQLLLENIEFFNLFLTNKELQESFSPTITTFSGLIDYIQKFNSRKRKFSVKFPKKVNRIIQQFLNYFTEFVEKAKGQKIRFDVYNHDTYLEIEIWANDEKNIEEISNYLQEYFGFLKQDINSLKVEVEIEVTSQDFNILILDLKQQLTHLKHSLEIAKFGKEQLEGEITYLRSIVKELAMSTLPKPSILINKESENPKNQFLKLLANNEIQKCIDRLMDIFFSTDNTEVINEIIIQSANFQEFEKNKALGILFNEELNMNRNKIISSIANILQKNM